MISSTVNPYGSGSGSGVPDDEAAYRASQHPHLRVLRPLLRAPIRTHPLGQPAADVREEGSAPRLRLLRPLLRAPIRAHPLEQPAADDVREEGSAPVGQRSTAMYTTRPPLFHPTINMHALGQPTVGLHAHSGWLGMPTAEGGTFVHEMYVVTAGGGGLVLIQPPLQSYYPVGPLGIRALQSSQDGVVGHWALPDVFPEIDGGTPYLARGSLPDIYPDIDGGTLYLPRGALPGTDVYPEIDRETPYLARGAFPVTDVFPEIDGGGTPYLARGARPVTYVFPEIDGGTPHLARGALIRSVGDGGGANAPNQHVIDMPPPLPGATTGTTDQARKFLERLLFGLLPACVVALGPLNGAPDGTKLAIYIIMAVLIVLILIGISTKAYAEHVARLSTCAGIFAMTVFVSMQFSRGIYVVIVALVGVALSAITLAV